MQVCIFYFLVVGDGGHICIFCTHLSSFSLPSVSDVRNYLNVWSGSIMFSPLNLNIVCLQASSDPFIHSLFCQVKMVSARVVFQIFISKFQLERD
jgi:hypothetical protein